MKKLKIYLSVILVMCIFASICPTSFASDYTLSWMFSPLDSVKGYVYSSNAYGFIVKSMVGDTYTTGLMNENGFVVPMSEKNFNYVDKYGYINYSIWGENDTQYGIMNVDGTDAPQFAKYDGMRPLSEDRFLCWVYNEYDQVSAIVDSNGNEIVPLGKYNIGWDSINWDYGVLEVWDENENVFVIDADGNIIAPANENEIIKPLSLTDRYLVVNEAENKSYIRKTDGTNIAEIDGCAVFMLYDRVEVEIFDQKTNTMTVHIYDLDGNKVKTDVYNDFGGRSYAFYWMNAPIKYDYDYINERKKYCIIDQDRNVVCEVDDAYMILNVYNNGIIKVADAATYESCGLIDIYGNVVVPLMPDTEIYYCSARDIYAFAKGDGTISIAKIQKEETISVVVNDSKIEFDQKPVIKDGRTLVPLRAIFEALGANVEWDGATSTVTATADGVNVSLVVGKDIMTVNGADVKLDVCAEIINGRTLVPARAVSEAFGCNVGWNGDTRTVIITK